MTEEVSDVNVGMTETQPENTAADAGVSQPEFTIPDEYKEKGWAKNIKSLEDLCKMNDNAQVLIGKKTIGIPSEEATEQELTDFYSKIRPQNQADYKVELDGEDKDLFEKLFYDNGLSQRQAKALVDGYKESVNKALAEMKSEEGYKKELANRFGDKADETVKTVTDFMKKEMSKEDLAALEGMPNNILGIMYSLVHTVQERYAVKDTDTGITGKPGVSSKEPDWAGYNKDAVELAKHPHSMADLNALRDKHNIPYK